MTLRDRFAARLTELVVRIDKLRATRPDIERLVRWGQSSIGNTPVDSLAGYLVEDVHRYAEALIPDPTVRAMALDDVELAQRWPLQTGTWPVGSSEWEQSGNFEAWSRYVGRHQQGEEHWKRREQWTKDRNAAWQAMFATLREEQRALNALGSAENQAWPPEVSSTQAADLLSRSDDQDAMAMAEALREGRHFRLPKESRWSPTAVALLTLAERRAITTLVPALDLLKGALLVFDGRDNEGQLVAAVGSAWLTILRFLEQDPDAVMQMSPRSWEEFVAGCYDRDGYKVTLTPRSADYGRDVIAEKRGVGTIRVLDQVKRYKPGHLVTAEEVRAFLFVAQADQATKAFITTTSDFAPRLMDDKFIAPLIKSGFLEPRPRERTFAWLKELSKKTH